MNKMEKIYESRKLTTDDDKFSLECLCKDNEVEQDWVWLTFHDIYEVNDLPLVWDNPDYIVDRLYPFLKR
jgi:hypothetical protein